MSLRSPSAAATTAATSSTTIMVLDDHGVGGLLGQQPPGRLATLLDQHVLAELGQPADRLCF